jgi:ABC-type sugar transport system ATPase subunit
MSAIHFERVTRRYGRVTALDAIDLAVADGSLTVLCGPPRSGKSVLLRLLVGLEAPDSGRILIDGQDIAALPPAARAIGYVPQSFALFPHISVRDNIAYPLQQRGVARDEIDRRMGPVAEILRIAPLLGKRPSQLSGGEKQRAAIARGVLQEARIFALDDPLVGLDFKLRESLMDDLKDMQEALRATFLYATSDSLEALTMAEQLAVLDRGALVEADGVERIYHEPRRLRSAELIGFPRCNILSGTANDRQCETVLGPVTLDLTELPEGGDVALALRPEHVTLAPPGMPDQATDGAIQGSGRILLMENLGAECVVHIELQRGDLAATLVSSPPTDAVSGLAVGDAFPFRIRPERIVAFGRASGLKLGTGRAVAYA